MIYDAQRFWTQCYSSMPPDHERGVSSTAFTQGVFHDLGAFFAKHSVTSMFDAGCNDCQWMNTQTFGVAYRGGDISLSAVARAMCQTDLDIMVHDITRDPIPPCDLLWIRDVMIHLSDRDRLRALQNWLASDIPWIMMTQVDGVTNQDIVYDGQFHTTQVNWYAEPWLFPRGTDCVFEMGTRKMELWHRDQIKDLPCIK